MAEVAEAPDPGMNPNPVPGDQPGMSTDNLLLTLHIKEVEITFAAH